MQMRVVCGVRYSTESLLALACLC